MREWLIAIRNEKRYTQKAVSEAAGISQPSYCNIENGERNPGVATAKKIAQFLGFDWTKFFVDTQKDGGDTTNEPDGSTEKAI